MPGIDCKRCGGPATPRYKGRGGSLLVADCDDPSCVPGSKKAKPDAKGDPVRKTVPTNSAPEPEKKKKGFQWW